MLRTISLACGATLLTATAWSQQVQGPPAPPKETITFTSAAQIEAIKARAEEARKSGAPIAGGALLNLAPYTANLEYRTAVGNAAIHETDAELFVVLEGSGTLTLGGKLAGEIRRTPNNQSAPRSEGGTPQRVAQGDVFVVPENTAHWFNVIDNGKLVLMSLHLPRAAPPK